MAVDIEKSTTSTNRIVKQHRGNSDFIVAILNPAKFNCF